MKQESKSSDGSIFSKDEKSYLTSEGVDFQLNDNNAGYVDRLWE